MPPLKTTARSEQFPLRCSSAATQPYKTAHNLKAGESRQLAHQPHDQRTHSSETAQNTPCPSPWQWLGVAGDLRSLQRLTLNWHARSSSNYAELCSISVHLILQRYRMQNREEDPFHTHSFFSNSRTSVLLLTSPSLLLFLKTWLLPCWQGLGEEKARRHCYLGQARLGQLILQ